MTLQLRNDHNLVYFNKISWDNIDGTEFYHDFIDGGKVQLVNTFDLKEEFYAFYDFFIILSRIVNKENYPTTDYHWSIMIEFSEHDEYDTSKILGIYRVEVTKISDYEYEEKVWDITDIDSVLIENDEHNNPLASKIDMDICKLIKRLYSYLWDKMICESDRKSGYREFYTRSHAVQHKIGKDQYTSELHNALEMLTAYRGGSVITDFIVRNSNFEIVTHQGVEQSIDDFEDVDVINFFYMYGELRKYRVQERGSITCLIDVPNSDTYKFIILSNIKLNPNCKSQFIIITRK